VTHFDRRQHVQKIQVTTSDHDPAVHIRCIPEHCPEPEKQEIADHAIDAHDLPGLSIAFRLPDDRIVSVCAGLADVERSLPMTSQTRMPGGSTGKTYVAAITTLLVEQRALDLDAFDRRYK
jgi:CubicO group peptidase (beta-lactamase class C family)